MLRVTHLIGLGARAATGGGPPPPPPLPEFNITYTGTTTDRNIRDSALGAGWNGSEACRVNLTIASGAVVRAGWPTNPALTTGGSWPGGSEIHITNNGQVRGAGGAGAGSVDNPGGFSNRNGQNGGDAFANEGVTCYIINNGTFAGGGGGGGRGADRIQTGVPDPQSTAGGGGGGGAGDKSGDGNSGLGGAQDGTTTSGGAFGSGTGSGTNFSPRSGDGGRGGDRGQPGQNGGAGAGGNVFQPAGNGGAAGRYATGNSNNIWLVTGTRLGLVAS